MKAIHLMAVAAIATASIAAQAQDTMYLVKGDHVVGKYAVDDVDYVTFELPADVNDNALWLEVGNVGKNNVTYTVKTAGDNVAYAHNVISYYEVNYMSLSYFGDMFENLSEEEQLQCMQTALSYNAYVAQGTQSFTQTDYDLDGTGPYGHFSVMPGTEYFLMAWEVNAETFEPLETFAFTTFNTADPAASSAAFNISFVRQNEQGLAFSITGDSNVKYVRTVYGMRNVMEMYAQYYGLDFLFGTFGQNWSLEDLQGVNESGIENATWPVDDAGEYVMYVRAYDYDGNMVQQNCYATAESMGAEGPSINVFSRSKTSNSVSVNFEITPSNVSEAYVNMMPESDVDDRLNMGYELYELAMNSTSIEITDQIHAMGEYTYNAEVPDDKWYSIIIYARDTDGNRTAQRMSFSTIDGSTWGDYNPVYSAPARRGLPAVKRIHSKLNPTIARVK